MAEKKDSKPKVEKKSKAVKKKGAIDKIICASNDLKDLIKNDRQELSISECGMINKSIATLDGIIKKLNR